jgi:membrane protein
MSLIGFIMPVSSQNIMDWINTICPAAIKPTVVTLANEIFDKSVSLVSLSAFTALWSASRGIAALERGVKRIYKTKRSSNLIADALMSVLYTFMFIALILATLVLQVFGNLISDLILKYIHFSITDIVLIKGVFSFAVMTLVFQLMYFFFNKRQSRFHKALPGAVFSAIGWIAFSNIYSVYIDNMSNYSYIYGSLTAIVLLMLWLYFCVIIFLIGAEINNLSRKKIERRQIQ